MNWKKAGRIAGITLAIVVPIGAGVLWNESRRFDERITRRWDVPLPAAVISPSAVISTSAVISPSAVVSPGAVSSPSAVPATPSEILARGKHLTESLGGCATGDCHGADLGGGTPPDIGPIGTFVGGNITQSGSGASYSDPEFLRLLQRGIKRDGTTVRFMPVQEFAWLPESDLRSIIAYVRSVAPAPTRALPETQVGLLGKILDNRNEFVIDVARYIQEHPPDSAPAPAPTAAYGHFVARSCVSCHGERLSGGPIPGAPPSVPTPSNLTFHSSGMAHYTRADFDQFIATGKRPDGREVSPFMPLSILRGMNGDEREALWAYLQSLPPTEFGNR